MTTKRKRRKIKEEYEKNNDIKSVPKHNFLRCNSGIYIVLFVLSSFVSLQITNGKFI